MIRSRPWQVFAAGVLAAMAAGTADGQDRETAPPEGARWHRGRRVYDRRIELHPSAPAATRVPEVETPRSPLLRGEEHQLRVAPAAQGPRIVRPPPRGRPRVREDEDTADEAWLLPDAGVTGPEVRDAWMQEIGDWGWLARDVLARQREAEADEGEETSGAEGIDPEPISGAVTGLMFDLVHGDEGIGRSALVGSEAALGGGLMFRDIRFAGEEDGPRRSMPGDLRSDEESEDLFDRLFSRPAEREGERARGLDAEQWAPDLRDDRAGMDTRRPERDVSMTPVFPVGASLVETGSPGTVEERGDMLREFRRGHEAAVDPMVRRWSYPRDSERILVESSSARTEFRDDSTEWSSPTAPRAAWEDPQTPRATFRSGTDSMPRFRGASEERDRFATFSDDWAPPRLTPRETRIGIESDPLFRR